MDVRASSRESPAEDTRRPYTRSTPCRRGEDTGSSAVSGRSVCVPAAAEARGLAAAETRLLGEERRRAVAVTGQDAGKAPASAEEAAQLHKSTIPAFSFTIHKRLMLCKIIASQQTRKSSVNIFYIY